MRCFVCDKLGHIARVCKPHQSGRHGETHMPRLNRSSRNRAPGDPGRQPRRKSWKSLVMTRWISTGPLLCRMNASVATNPRRSARIVVAHLIARGIYFDVHRIAPRRIEFANGQVFTCDKAGSLLVKTSFGRRIKISNVLWIPSLRFVYLSPRLMAMSARATGGELRTSFAWGHGCPRLA